jgi:hypothetical protein
MRCLEGTSVGLREQPDERELDPYASSAGTDPGWIAPECVTPTRVEPAPWCDRPDSRGRIRTSRMQRYTHRSRPVRCGLDDVVGHQLRRRSCVAG